METLHTYFTGPILAHGIMAFFGAIAHASRAYRNGESKGLLDFFLLTIMSSFSGIVFALVASSMTDSQYFTLAAAGSGGFLGVEGLSVLAAKIRDSLANVVTKK